MGIFDSIKLALLLASVSVIIFLFAITFVVLAQEIHIAVGIVFFGAVLYLAFRVLSSRLTKL